MNTPITAWIDLALHQAQRCHHLAWFLYGYLKREHVLNVNAFVASWVREVAWPSHRLPGAIPFKAIDTRPNALHQRGHCVKSP